MRDGISILRLFDVEPTVTAPSDIQYRRAPRETMVELNGAMGTCECCPNCSRLDPTTIRFNR